jgi:hypothetical protein
VPGGTCSAKRGASAASYPKPPRFGGILSARAHAGQPDSIRGHRWTRPCTTSSSNCPRPSCTCTSRARWSRRHIFELAQRNGIELEYDSTPGRRSWRAYDFHDLPSFLKIYYAAWTCCATGAGLLRDLTYRLLRARRGRQRHLRRALLRPAGAHDAAASCLRHGDQRGIHRAQTRRRRASSASSRT